ncbi:MAG: hypothetical protein ABSD29_23315, partial [Verrucomicrobiota bacterium]
SESWSASDCPKHEFVSESVIKYARLRAFRAILQVPSAFLRFNCFGCGSAALSVILENGGGPSGFQVIPQSGGACG